MDSTDVYDCPDEPDPSTDNVLMLPEAPKTSDDDPGEDSDIQGGVTQRADADTVCEVKSPTQTRPPDGFELRSSSFGGEGDVTNL